MKTDNEFLMGVYNKAHSYSSLEEKPKGFDQPKQNHFKRYIGIAAAAVLIAVVAPSLYFLNNVSYEMYEPVNTKTRTNEPVAAAFTAESVNTDEFINGSELIVTAQVKKIDKSVYEYSDTNHMTTTVTLKVSQFFKGDGESTIKLKVNGGYDQKTSNFVPYEATFKKKEKVLLFLVKSGDNEYTLRNSAYGKYSEVNATEQSGVYMTKDGETITIEELKSRISELG